VSLPSFIKVIKSPTNFEDVGGINQINNNEYFKSAGINSNLQQIL
jgi:hypothetical protein